MRSRGEIFELQLDVRLHRRDIDNTSRHRRLSARTAARHAELELHVLIVAAMSSPNFEQFIPTSTTAAEAQIEL